MADGDILVFLDAACEIHDTGEKRWKEYLKYLEEFDCILFDHENFFVRQLTKMDLLVHFSVDTDEEVLNRRQFMGGVQIIKKTAFPFTRNGSPAASSTKPRCSTTLHLSAPKGKIS